MEFRHHYSSPLGGITMAGGADGLSGLWFDGQKYFPSSLLSRLEEGSLPVFTQTDEWLDRYFLGNAPDFTPKLNINGTAFRKAVWELLLSIPYGRTVTYGDIAGIIARQKGCAQMSARAVGGAVGRNPISLIIPCHRVVGADGSLTGYAGGIDRKMKLLSLERAERIAKPERFLYNNKN